MPVGACRLCGNWSELCDSHALPNSLFRNVFRQSAGKAVVVTDDASTPTCYSSDSWDTELLCRACEDLLNERYDKYGVEALRGGAGGVVHGADGVTFTNVDRRRLRMFVLSVLWRMSVSSHRSYSNIDLPSSWEEELHEALHVGKPVPRSRYTVAIYRLRDSTDRGGFSNEDLQAIIMSPFARKFPGFISICFLFFGFFIEVFLPKVPKAYSARPGVLFGASPIFFAPYLEVLDVPEIVSILGRGLQKEDEGRSRIR